MCMTATLCVSISRALYVGAMALTPVFSALAEPNAAAGAVHDLACPGKPGNGPERAQGLPERRTAMTGTRTPGENDLGRLAKPVVRPQAPLSHAVIAGFAPGSPMRPRRIAIWGDSHLAGGSLASTLMQSLQDSGHSVGTHVLPPTMGRANVALPGLRDYCIGSDWTTQVAYTSAHAMDTGPALATRSVDAGRSSHLWLDLRNASREPEVNEVQLIYRSTAGASLSYVIDNGKRSTVRLAPTTTSSVVTFGAQGLLSTLKLNVSSGKLALLGVVLNRKREPDITLDAFGIPSATVRGWANVEQHSLRQALHGVRYDGVVLEYGTNEGADADFDPDRYSALLDRALRNLRQVFPDASCVLVGPPDRGVLKNQRGAQPPLLAYASVHQRIAQIQQRIGSRFSCEAWSWQDLMGGPGGSYGWARANPRLMGRDLVHLSPDGYRLTGRSLARSLGWSR
jgi:lysophospholipase L1-like esterase